MALSHQQERPVAPQPSPKSRICANKTKNMFHDRGVLPSLDGGARARGGTGSWTVQTGLGKQLGSRKLGTATLLLSGPCRVMLQDGRDITPTSALRQAILAVLVLTKGQVKSRKALQVMFWGSADTARASSSLRTAIYLLKQDLASLGAEAIRADRHSISLAPNCVVGDPQVGRGPEFLEGLDLSLADCEGFEDWLRHWRTPEPQEIELDAKAEPRMLRAAGVTRAPRTLAPRILALGLLPSSAGVLGQGWLQQAEGLIDDIAQFFLQTTFLDVHDLRGYDSPVAPLPIASGYGPTHWLQAVPGAGSDGSRLCLRLIEAATRRLVWLSSPVEVAGLGDGVAAWVLGDTIADRMRSGALGEDAPNLFPLTALTALFSLDSAIVQDTETHLERLIAQGGGPILECLLLFTQVFKANESMGTHSELNVTVVCEMLSRISSADPHLALCESLAGYSVHMLLGENELAEQLVESAYRRAPNLPLNLDHLAVLRLMRGDLDGAELAFSKCIAAGSLSPIRYTYEVTGAMICLARGDLSRSLHFANQAMFRKPRYLASLRYAMAGLALSDKPQDARRMLERIEVLRPGYDLSSWAESFVRRTPAAFSNRLVRSLRQHQLL
jgi:hypothetical protein